MLQGLTVFIIFLGPLIFFHELGHFLFARLCGVRVETFSIGFGPKLFKFRRGDTDYAISLIPLGGYVKMFGDDPTGKDEVPEDQRQFAFTHKSKWRKFWIVFGGPLANFILAFVIYYGITLTGETVPQVKFGNISKDTSFYSSGLRTGDVLQKVNQVEITSLEDLSMIDEKINTLELARDSKRVELTVDMFSKTFIESLIELDQFLRKPIVVNGAGEKFGISMDENFNPSISLEEINALAAQNIFLIKLDDQLNPVANAKSVNITLSQNELLKNLKDKKYYARDMMVDGLIVDDPADKAMIKKGDILLSINGQEIFNFNELRNIIQSLAQKKDKLAVSYMRNNKVFNTVLEPVAREVNGQKIFAIGIYSSAQMIERQMVQSKPRGLIESLGIAMTKTMQGSYAVFDGFKKLFTGSASLKNLGGPISIAKQASYSLDVSLSYFFKMMALISINLGILNLLPIPILDGGHILFIMIEAVTGGPVPKKVMMIAQQFGLSVLLLLMIFAIGNDIVRLFN